MFFPIGFAIQDGNSIRLSGAYDPSTKKLCFEMSKKIVEKIYMYTHTICAFVKFREEPIFM
jgi:hypothetical protein